MILLRGTALAGGDINQRGWGGQGHVDDGVLKSQGIPRGLCCPILSYPICRTVFIRPCHKCTPLIPLTCIHPFRSMHPCLTPPSYTTTEKNYIEISNYDAFLSKVIVHVALDALNVLFFDQSAGRVISR